MAKTTYQLEQEIAALNMQIEGHAKAGYEKELRIAELEKKLADHSAQAFSIGETYAAALTRVAELESQLNKALSQIAAVHTALKDAAPIIANSAAEAGYGYHRPENPHDFTPDADLCTEEEIANHKAACEAFDKGEYVHDDTCCGIGIGMHILYAPWGIGSYVIHFEEVERLLALIPPAPNPEQANG